MATITKTTSKTLFLEQYMDPFPTLVVPYLGFFFITEHKDESVHA